MTANEALKAVLAGHTLDEAQATRVFEAVLAENVDPAVLGGVLAALYMRGETADELVGAARTLRAHAIAVEGVADGAVDTCGTGGDGAGTFNISTAAAFVVAGAGVPVAKHGNRAVSGPGGSADVLDALGVALELPFGHLGRCLREVGFVYLHAPRHHPIMGRVASVRRALGIRTIFNFVGPLANPAGVRRQVVGVPTTASLERMAVALGRLGAEHAWVVCGDQRFDELALSGPTRVCSVRAGRVESFEVRPEDVGLAPAPMETLVVRSVSESAERIRGVLDGAAGPARDVVCLNAGAALVVAGVVPDLRAGVARAAASIDGGQARAVLERLRAFAAARERSA
jgi:anthranilate phosphoribosyltransferase